MNKHDFLNYFCEFTEKISESFLKKSQVRKGFFAKLFGMQSAEEKLVIEIQTFIEKVREKRSYPRLAYYEENDVLKKIAEIQNKFTDLIVKNYTSKKLEYREFNQLYAKYAKHANGLVLLITTSAKKEINLSYLKYYLDCREVGSSIPTKYELLRQESLFYLKSYIKVAKNEPIKKMILAIIDSIKDENQGINQHSNSNQLHFLNLIKFLNTLRLALIDKNEKQLLPQISQVIDRALDVIRPEKDYDLKKQKLIMKNDVTSKKIISFEKINKGPVGIKIGFFLDKKEKTSSQFNTFPATTQLLF